MTEAIFGLVGVVIGGLLNGSVAWIAERTRSKRAARIVIRLVAVEIEENHISIDMGLNQETFAQMKFAAGTAAWDAWRETLADVLPVAEWNVVCSYYVMEGHMIALAEENEYPDEFNDGDREIFAMTMKSGEAALACVRKFAGEKAGLRGALKGRAPEESRQTAAS
jgi:hypothetical protein